MRVKKLEIIPDYLAIRKEINRAHLQVIHRTVFKYFNYEKISSKMFDMLKSQQNSGQAMISLCEMKYAE